MAKLTTLQKTITKEHLIEICRKMHFTLTDEQLSKLEYYFKYTWVCVQFRVKGYGYVSFGIDNHHQTSLLLSGPNVTKDEIKDALERGIIHLEIWRFSDDEIYKREASAKEYVESNLVKTTVNEYYEHYYIDTKD